MSDLELSQGTGGIDRRAFLRGVGAAVVTAAALPPHAGWPTVPFAARAGTPLASRPNILILMTDQERPLSDLLLGQCCAMPPKTPPGNVHALLEAAKKYGTYRSG